MHKNLFAQVFRHHCKCKNAVDNTIVTKDTVLALLDGMKQIPEFTDKDSIELLDRLRGKIIVDYRVYKEMLIRSSN